MTAIVDTLVDPLLLSLRDCLRAELMRTSSGPVCRCMVVHSLAAPIMDGCDCDCTLPDATTGNGDAWVRLVRMDPDTAGVGLTPQACPTAWQAVIEIGTYRCAPISEDASALPEQEVSGFALAMGSDRAALLRVLGCCEALEDRDVAVEFYQPVGPEGGCGGGLLQFRVAVMGGGGC